MNSYSFIIISIPPYPYWSGCNPPSPGGGEAYPLLKFRASSREGKEGKGKGDGSAGVNNTPLRGGGGGSVRALVAAGFYPFSGARRDPPLASNSFPKVTTDQLRVQLPGARLEWRDQAPRFEFHFQFDSRFHVNRTPGIPRPG